MANKPHATDPEERIRELGIALPTGITAAANYVPGVRRDGLLFLSGQIPREGIGVAVIGKVGDSVSLPEARRAAAICALRLLAAARDMLGTLNAVDQVVELTVYVHAVPEFDEPSAVADAASDLFLQLFGPAGGHARSAVCVAQLPKGAAVEISAILGVTDMHIAL